MVLQFSMRLGAADVDFELLSSLCIITKNSQHLKASEVMHILAYHNLKGPKENIPRNHSFKELKHFFKELKNLHKHDSGPYWYVMV